MITFYTYRNKGIANKMSQEYLTLKALSVDRAKVKERYSSYQKQSEIIIY